MPKAAAPTQPWHVVRRSSIHSRGVFALRDIPKETEIIEYLGEKISKAESERRALARMAHARKTGEAAVYIFNLNEEEDLDGSSPKNIARLLNHSCAPNCEALQDENDHIWLCAKRDIGKGEELTFNYGFDLENWSEHECRCGTENCVGFIVGEEYWPKLKKLLEKRAKIVRTNKKKAATKKSAKKTSAATKKSSKKTSAAKKKTASKKTR